MKHSIYRWLNIVAFIFVIFINWLSTALPLGGRTTKEVSDLFPVLFTPAPYAFSIWGVIYLLLFGFIIFQATSYGQSRVEVLAIGPWFIISSFLNILWLFLFHYLYLTYAFFIMLLLLLSLVVIYKRVNSSDENNNKRIRCLVKAPFSVYLGWISVATLVNLSIVLYNNQLFIGTHSDTILTILLIISATVLAIYVGKKYSDLLFVLVFIWAFIAIAVEQWNISIIAYIALGCSILLMFFSIFLKVKKFSNSN